MLSIRLFGVVLSLSLASRTLIELLVEILVLGVVRT
jgi:hypothetical protein